MSLPYEPTFSAALHADLRRDANPTAALRACVDLPVMVRTQGLRLIVSAGALSFAQGEDARAAARRLWDHAVAGYDAASACLAPAGGATLHRVVEAILADVLPGQPAAVAVLGRFRALASALRDAAEAGRVVAEYDDLMAFTYTTYVPTLAALETAIRDAIEAHHAARAQAAVEARARAQLARGEIGRIARMVRSISINASVEAARAGDAGRAFDVIATEIRALSERTETATADMGTSIDAILGNLRVD